MLVCPNRNTKEYKELNALLDTDIIEYLFERNNYEYYK